MVRPLSTYGCCEATSTEWLLRPPGHVAEASRPARGLLDTSVVVDLHAVPAAVLPLEVAVSAITMAELAAGPHAASNAAERARRQDRLQRAEAIFDSLPFDGDAARAYGRVYAAVADARRKARGSRAGDLLIAAATLAAQIPLYTRNLDDFRGLDEIIDVVEV